MVAIIPMNGLVNATSANAHSSESGIIIFCENFPSRRSMVPNGRRKRYLATIGGSDPMRRRERFLARAMLDFS